ncbi:MAG TPA: SRPBCC family protein [Candidatus Limnocylindria bacterium]|jgi:ribosome-associated toxin RatA of RatAB toxin-antitoxin module
MKSVTRINIAAPYARIFDLAADVERWPERLPHYRYVRRLPAPDGERRFAMGAKRGPIPVRWEAIQRPLPEERRIEFVHVGGVTRGMRVAWEFSPVANIAGEAWNVSIHHELDLGWPLIGGVVADRIIGPQFIDAIAGRTLRTIRDLAERGG